MAPHVTNEEFSKGILPWLLHLAARYWWSLGKSSAGIRKRKKTALSKFSSIQASRRGSAVIGGLPTLIDHIQPQVESSIAHAKSPRSFQSLIKKPEILCETPPSRAQKRKSGLEEKGLNHRQQGPSPPADKPVVAFKRLNKKHLDELNRLNRCQEPEMAKTKRSRSQSSITDVTEDNTTTVSTPKSSLSLSNYRLINLDRQRIVFEHGHMPEQVQTRLDSIFRSPISEDDQREVAVIANSLCDDFINILRAACREDDSVELIYNALELMNKKLLNQAFAIRRKAGKTFKPFQSCLAHILLAWNPTLKPVVHRRPYSSLLPASNDPNSVLNASTKERQPYITPDGSASTMPPPQTPSKPDLGDDVKTPCPDITTGLHHHVVAAKLESIGVTRPHCDEFLKGLQYEKALISCPAQSALLLRFPSLVVEGKSYATGKSLYEAQNQAAVSGSIMLIIQHRLSELAENKPLHSPLAFSVCSEGPVIELWVHYSTSDANVRYYHTHFLQICHASAFTTVVEFLLAVLRIMQWAKTSLLNDLTKQLLGVWKNYQDVTTCT